MQMLHKKISDQKGSYTIEVALLMGILLSVLIAVIYIGFWYHDKDFCKAQLMRRYVQRVCIQRMQAGKWNRQ